MLRTAARGTILRKTLKTHTTDHFMPLGILLASFILAAIRVSFESMSMQEYPDLQDSSLLTLWSEKKKYFLENVRVIVFNVQKRGLFLLC